MVKSLEDGSLIAPFLLKCYEMVNDESTDELISWSGSYTNSFIISDVANFTSQLLPKYFKHSNFASFIRQLNIYGFRKTDTDRWEFTNEAFVKGQKHLLKNIVRRKQIQSQVPKKSSQPMEACSPLSKEDKRVDLRKEVESLKTDKNTLMQELIKLRQHQQSSHSKLILLREQLKGMEKHQQQMLSFIVMVLQNPSIFVQLLHPRENNWCAAESSNKVVRRVADVRYQLPMPEAPKPASTPQTSEVDTPMELDISDDIKEFLANIDFTMGPLEDIPLPFEGHGPLVLPEVADNYMLELEQLLLSSPIRENMQSEDHDTEVSNDSQTKMLCEDWEEDFIESDSRIQRMDHTDRNELVGSEGKLESYSALDNVTAKMGLLSSENGSVVTTDEVTL